MELSVIRHTNRLIKVLMTAFNCKFKILIFPRITKFCPNALCWCYRTRGCWSSLFLQRFKYLPSVHLCLKISLPSCLIYIKFWNNFKKTFLLSFIFRGCFLCFLNHLLFIFIVMKREKNSKNRNKSFIL